MKWVKILAKIIAIIAVAFALLACFTNALPFMMFVPAFNPALFFALPALAFVLLAALAFLFKNLRIAFLIWSVVPLCALAFCYSILQPLFEARMYEAGKANYVLNKNDLSGHDKIRFAIVKTRYESNPESKGKELSPFVMLLAAINNINATRVTFEDGAYLPETAPAFIKDYLKSTWDTAFLA